MNKVKLIAFIDDFGDILARDPKAPYGLGCFVCRQEDADILNNDLVKNYIPQKIHLREYKTKEKLSETIEKTCSFFKNCKKEFYGGGIVYSNPKARSEVRELYPYPSGRNRIKDDLEIFDIIDSLKLIYLPLALKFKVYSEVDLTVFFEVPGDYKDFCKKMKRLDKQGYILKSFKVFEEKLKLAATLEGFSKLSPKLPKFTIHPCYVQPRQGMELAGLADVFAHISKRVSCTNDQYSNELYQILEPYFNLFDEFNEESILRRGILNAYVSFKNDNTPEVVKAIDQDINNLYYG